MDVTQLALTWVGWPNGEKLVSTCVQICIISTKLSTSHRKSTQVRASPGQTKLQVDPSLQLASPFGPGLKKMDVGQTKNYGDKTEFLIFGATQQLLKINPSTGRDDIRDIKPVFKVRTLGS